MRAHLHYDMSQLIDRITSINRAWKIAAQDTNVYINKTLADRLRYQKSNWQIELIRTYPDKVWLKLDIECQASEPIYSVRFGSERIITSDGDSKWNAEHIPERIAKDLLTAEEFKKAIQPKF